MASCKFLNFVTLKPPLRGEGRGEGDYETLAALFDFTSKTWGIRIEKQINKFVFAE